MGGYAYESDVHDLFRLHNRNSLKGGQIFVSRATGENKDPKDLEKDIDYGHDDDFFYDSDDGPCAPRHMMKTIGHQTRGKMQPIALDLVKLGMEMILMYFSRTDLENLLSTMVKHLESG